MFEFLVDQNFLSALAVTIGPLAFFAAPTEEIEHLIFFDDADVGDEAIAVPDFIPIDADIAKAA